MLVAAIDHDTGSSEVQKYARKSKVDHTHRLLHCDFDIDIVEVIENAVEIDEENGLALGRHQTLLLLLCLAEV